MKLWLLKAIDGAEPWEPWYDKTFGFVIAAESEEGARAIAQMEGGPETHGPGYSKNGCPAWLESRFSSCEEIGTTRWPCGVILQEQHAA